MASYDVGDVVRVSVVFTDEAGPADPGVVTLSYRVTGGTAVILTYGVDAALVRGSVGAYHSDVPMLAAGTFSWRWAGTGQPQAAAEGSFEVLISQFA